jgi:hypothetical protein
MAAPLESTNSKTAFCFAYFRLTSWKTALTSDWNWQPMALPGLFSFFVGTAVRVKGVL